MTPGWLADHLAMLVGAWRAGRMPHALLLHEAPGAGGDWLATWVAQLMLCTAPAQAPPCGNCAGCRRALQGEHPDLLSVRPTDDSQQIRIEQVRELAQQLSFTSHQGGYKVAVVSPADAMNRFAANALLKTLEEPTARTVLIAVATQPAKLPATIRSRCQRIRVAAPSRAQALSWLTATRGAADWNAVLEIVGEAPMLAAQMDPAGAAQVGEEVCAALEGSLGGQLEPVATSERWVRSELGLRLQCVENWLTKRIRGHFGAAPFLTEVGAVPYSPERGTDLNIRALFGLLDGVRDLKSSLETPINRGLALEELLRRLASREIHDALTMTG
ncbi:MAG TPA: DNA polymerase III subunit delta' [Steroidobacteraceae bacterium]